SDIFVARYSADGLPLATQRFGGADSDAGNGVAVDRSGRPVVPGSYRLGVDFGGTVLGGAGMDDIFLAGLRSRSSGPASSTSVFLPQPRCSSTATSRRINSRSSEPVRPLSATARNPSAVP